ncbi:MAG: prolyl oligopeptidase family serine peptidase, partial [Eubacteriales bacterium]|nr:prolyl oligopeptidase family serine peptidase [Eubacteriales bacterium]
MIGNSKIGLLRDEDTAQICCATNRIVIASQYRGADGKTGIDQFGGADLNDVIKLIDLCEYTFDFVDMNDLCIVGVSRGGMMSYMTARQDERVKGIIAISAVSDLFQAYDDRDDMKTIL